MTAILVGVGVLIISAVLVSRQSRSEVRRAERHMVGREPMTDHQFGERYFPAERADIAARLRAIMARHIAVDLSRLHPDDRIVADIRMDALDSLSTVEFVLDAEKEFGISIPDSAAEHILTLRDFTEHVHQTLHERSA